MWCATLTQCIEKLRIFMLNCIFNNSNTSHQLYLSLTKNTLFSFFESMEQVKITKKNKHESRKRQEGSKEQYFFWKLMNRDILQIIMGFLSQQPYHALMLSMVNRQLHETMSCAPMWYTFYFEILHREMNLRKSKYLKRMRELWLFLQGDAKRVIQILFSKHCQVCGSKYGHFVSKTLLKRTCKRCLNENLISNGKLFFKYGINYFDIAEKIYRGQGLLLPGSCFHVDYIRKCRDIQASKPMSLKALPCQGVSLVKELRQYKECDHMNLVFFWKPDIEKIMQIKMEEEEKKQVERWKAAQTLTAVIIRLANSCIVHCFKGGINDPFWNDPLSHVLAKKQKMIENMRSYYRLKLPRMFIPGGPWYALPYYGKKTIDFWWKPSYDATIWANIRQILLESKCLVMQRSPMENILMYVDL